MYYICFWVGNSCQAVRYTLEALLNNKPMKKRNLLTAMESKKL